MPLAWLTPSPVRCSVLVLILLAAKPLLDQLEREESGSTAGIRGLHLVGRGVVWASGTKGTVLRSEDDGFVWQQCSIPPGGQDLDFRGIWAWNANEAVVMSSGAGPNSRLFLTTDGGAHWKLLLQNQDPNGFYDGILFVSRTSGFLLGDPVDGRFVLMQTSDGGATWTRNDSQELSSSPKGEGAFAASNSSLAVDPEGDRICFATGGVGGARIFCGSLAGLSGPAHWSVRQVPLASGKDSAGVFSLAFRDSMHGVAVGGDYKLANERRGIVATTHDGGKTWVPSKQLPGGFRSSVSWSTESNAWIAAGTNGVDISRDDGQTWQSFAGGNWNVLSLPWVAGPEGSIAKLRVPLPNR